MIDKLTKIVVLLLLVSCSTSFTFTTKFKDNEETIPDRLLIIYSFDPAIKGFLYNFKDNLQKKINDHGTFTVSYGRSNFDKTYHDSVFIENRCNGILYIGQIRAVNKTCVFDLTLVSIKTPHNQDIRNNKSIWKAEFKFNLKNNADSITAMLSNRIIEGLYR
jgi:hypothetical protein